MKSKRSRGQNFLVDQNMLKKIVDAADIAPGDTVVEIGAGTGNLTAFLAERAKRVLAIEIDNDLIPILRDRCAQYPNVNIIHDDARTFDPTSYKLQATSYSVVANIPYNITSLLIRHLLEADPSPSKMILLIQKEVARRICAQPPDMSMLSVAVQYYADPRILFSVPRTCFSPRPNVDSAVVSFSLYEKGGKMGTGIMVSGVINLMTPDTIIPIFPSSFFHLLHAGFAHKRKLLISNLLSVIPSPKDEGSRRLHLLSIFKSVNIPPNARAQELSVAQWKKLSSVLFPFSGGEK